MDQAQNSKKFDLEDRTLKFGKFIITLVNSLPKNQVNLKICDQLIRPGTSIGANYREANDSLGKKDFYMRVRVARKEAKETTYWLELLQTNNLNSTTKIAGLMDECNQLTRILSAIIKSNQETSIKHPK